jgi:hypothetical protein
LPVYLSPTSITTTNHEHLAPIINNIVNNKNNDRKTKRIYFARRQFAIVAMLGLSLKNFFGHQR